MTADFSNGLAAFEAGEYQQAIAALEPLALDGHADAQAMMGNAYHLGLGVDVDVDKAIHWYQLAASQGHAVASNNLACLLPERSQHYYQQAQDQGFQHAPVSEPPRNPKVVISRTGEVPVK